MQEIEIHSRAKVNLTLEVGERRADGYHEIDSVVQIIDLTDRLIVRKAPVGVIDVLVDGGGAPEGPENLVYKACEAFFMASGVDGGAQFVLRKNIPMQAGLGGGSGNAAAALAALDELYGTALSPGDLCAIASSVGSDAGLFVIGGTMRVGGRGDLIRALPDAPELHLVVVKPDVGVSTAWAYSRLDTMPRQQRQGASEQAERAVASGDREALIESLWNDFDQVVADVYSEVREAGEVLIGAGARRVMLCGSGSAVFGVFDSKEAARAAAKNVRGQFPRVFATRSLSRAESRGVLLCQ
ncbi:MAG: 4-(cytidine 5'-diphospho)-2-C-methyl-D-erythritol kinase [Armatimonadota bacterium]